MGALRRVLVVDDAEDTCDLYSEILRFNGYHVACAADGVEALQKIEEVTPDVVLMDLTMPRMDGLEVTKLIKANPEQKGITVVVLTGYGDPKILDRAREAGADVVCTKPLMPSELLQKLKTLLPG